MLETSARLLRLLSLLQGRRDWTGAELADRLGVGARTVRRDVDKLRTLGYPVHAAPGVAGGYRLGAGAALPPLLLDDEEAVAVAVGLRTAAGGTVAGIEETSLRALSKLEQVLPARLRPRVNALHTYVVAGNGTGPTVDAEVLTLLAGACRDRERVRLDYRANDGTASLRTVEPHRLVHVGRRWYLLAWDDGRDDWRTFRVDRLSPRTPTGARFAPRELPDPDVAGYVARGVSGVVWRHRARVRLHAPAEEFTGWLQASASLEPVDERTCVLETSAESLYLLAVHLGTLHVDFDVLDPPELVDEVRRLAERYQRASGR